MIREILHVAGLWGASAVGLFAAALWFKAALTIVKKGNPKFKGGFVLDHSKLGEIDLWATVAEQSRWNKWAALVTAAAIVLQAIALPLST